VRIAARPEDFLVDEIPLYAPSGAGAHTFVRVEKRGCSTEHVARALARAVEVAPRDVGYAGRKDAAALARQWLSVPGLDPVRALALEGPGWRVLEAAHHGHKLRTGQLRGNRFELVVRELAPGEIAAAPGRLEALLRTGIPNRFGGQRFGAGEGAARGRALLAGAALPRDRRTARFWLSALQAELFNAVLEARPLPLDAVEEGDVAFLHASGACFVIDEVAREAPRAVAFEISATGPIFGTHVLEPRGAPLAREHAAYEALGIPRGAALRPPRGIRLRGARRPLRVRPASAACEAAGRDALRLRFELPPGSYATVLVEALLG
jgi:tRNA pseudouridine13 synthase